MSFHESAQNIRVEDGSRLVAELRNEGGEFVHAEIDLNQVLGNNDGQFEWAGTGFTDSTEPDSTTFNIEGEANVPVLRATLKNCAGESVDANVNLAEKIGNENGEFQLV
ncbi:CVNH domain-containing protein [Aspergillus undulatus]|uniref:CVNH domain-containing protein n=1 Tax=Aspergillus undulatus TaxID=1810928 RepID=UPI003CCDFCFC